MPYLVQVMEDDENGGGNQLNTLEDEGWTLMHVIPAYGHLPPQFILHKSADPDDRVEVQEMTYGS